MSETIPQSQRRYIQTALIEAQRCMIAHQSRPWWKQSKETTDSLKAKVAHWEAELTRHDREYGAPPIPANPAWDEFGVLRSSRGYEISSQPDWNGPTPKTKGTYFAVGNPCSTGPVYHLNCRDAYYTPVDEPRETGL